MENFAQKLTELRKQKRLSQDELASKLDISQSSISNYESGASTPDIDLLKKIADYFKISITYLFSDDILMFHAINKNKGGNNDSMENGTINMMYEKLIELYELRLKEKDEEITYLRGELEKNKK